MNCKMNALKRRSPKRKFSLFSDAEDEDCETLSLVSSDERKSNNPTIRNLIGRICKLDEKIIENEGLFQSLKEERKSVQEEMCSIILSSEVSPTHSKNSQLFLQLCSFEDSAPEKNGNDEDDKVKSSDQQAKNKRKNERCDKNFITRNIELAKQRLLTQYSLTDEEKIHLESILSDIDSEEYSTHERPFKSRTGTISRRLLKKLTPRKVSEENQFKIREDELTAMEDLDNKIKEMCKSNSTETIGLKCSTSELPLINVEEDVLENAEKRGRYWKHHHLQKRLQSIDKDLASIAAKDAEEKERLEKQNQQIPFLYTTVKNKEEDKSVNKENRDDKF